MSVRSSAYATMGYAMGYCLALSATTSSHRTSMKMKTNPPNVASIVRLYRKSMESLERIKSERFYHGTDVMVNDPRYKGPGVAVTDTYCPPNEVTVSLPNGNSWRYPIESVEPIKRQPGTGFASSSSSAKGVK